MWRIGGIRTPGTGVSPYNGLAILLLTPLPCGLKHLQATSDPYFGLTISHSAIPVLDFVLTYKSTIRFHRQFVLNSVVRATSQPVTSRNRAPSSGFAHGEPARIFDGSTAHVSFCEMHGIVTIEKRLALSAARRRAVLDEVLQEISEGVAL